MSRKENDDGLPRQGTEAAACGSDGAGDPADEREDTAVSGFTWPAGATGFIRSDVFYGRNTIEDDRACESLPSEIKAGELRAWRCWRVDRDGSLRSMAMDTPWPRDTPVMGNVKLAHEGVHAWKTKEAAIKYAGRGLPARDCGRRHG